MYSEAETKNSSKGIHAVLKFQIESKEESRIVTDPRGFIDAEQLLCRSAFSRAPSFYWESPQVDPHISAIVRFVVDGIAKLICVSVVVEAVDSPAPNL